MSKELWSLAAVVGVVLLAQSAFRFVGEQRDGERMAARQHHFMPPALLDSQFATLEEPGADEKPLVVQVEASKEAIVEQVVRELRLG